MNSSRCPVAAEIVQHSATTECCSSKQEVSSFAGVRFTCFKILEAAGPFRVLFQPALLVGTWEERRSFTVRVTRRISVSGTINPERQFELAE